MFVIVAPFKLGSLRLKNVGILQIQMRILLRIVEIRFPFE